jgi:hypothetical protein
MIYAILSLVKAGASALEAWAKLAPLRELIKLQKERREIIYYLTTDRVSNAELLYKRKIISDLDAAIKILNTGQLQLAKGNTDPGWEEPGNTTGGHPSSDVGLPPASEGSPSFDEGIEIRKAERV